MCIYKKGKIKRKKEIKERNKETKQTKQKAGEGKKEKEKRKKQRHSKQSRKKKERKEKGKTKGLRFKALLGKSIEPFLLNFDILKALDKILMKLS